MGCHVLHIDIFMPPYIYIHTYIDTYTPLKFDYIIYPGSK